MDSILAGKLIILGVLVESSPDTTKWQLKNIYEQSSTDESLAVHAAIIELIEQLSRLGFAQNNFVLSKKINLLVDLANLAVPGLTDQVPIASGTDEVDSFIRRLQILHPAWVKTAGEIQRSKHFIRNDEACSVLIADMPSQTSKSRSRDFLRQLGENPPTAHFISMLSNEYGLESPHFPFDWANNVYHLMCFHLPSPSQEILNARVYLWTVLFQLSKIILPSPHPIQTSGKNQ